MTDAGVGFCLGGGADFLLGRREMPRIPVGDHDAAAFGGDSFRGGEADAARAAGDDRIEVFEEEAKKLGGADFLAATSTLGSSYTRSSTGPNLFESPFAESTSRASALSSTAVVDVTSGESLSHARIPHDRSAPAIKTDARIDNFLLRQSCQ